MTCERCERRTQELVALLRQRLINQQAVIDSLTEELDDTQSLARILARELSARDPYWLESADEDTRELWDIVAPLGRDPESMDAVYPSMD